MTEPALRETQLPRGTVTFMFTDIQGSTKLLQRLGDGYGPALSTHRSLMREAFSARSGVEVDTQGDAFFVAFPDATQAVRAAVECQRVLIDHPWEHGDPVLVRMGLHTGSPTIVDEHYVGLDVHRGARICGAAHGGQIVVSAETMEALDVAARAGLDVVALGPHRLKDLEEPENLFQISVPGFTDHFPALRSISPPTNVPHAAGRLVGRVGELADLRKLVLDDGARLVTVTGPGGTGKTRVAAALTLDVLDHFPYGAFFVDLSAITEAAFVPSSIADVLGLGIETADEPVAALVEHIGPRRMLLVLDNFEHVLDAAAIVSGLVARCPGLSIVVTSRAILSIRAEREYPIPPLGLPVTTLLQDVEVAEATQLFVERAAAVRFGFELTEDNAEPIARVCELLDGLPLAIELAAARVKLFEPAALLGRLDDHLKLLTAGTADAPARHRALRATIDWSFDLLEPVRRTFFRDFSVFNGGATIDAIEMVMGGDIETLDSLTALVNNSLIRRRERPGEEPRFAMLQTILGYAREMLDGAPDAGALRDRHAEWFTSLAQSGPDAVANDYENMISALDWLSSRAVNSPEAGARGLGLAAALGWHWYTHGEAALGSQMLKHFLSLAVDASPETRAYALRRLGVLLEQLREPEGAATAMKEALHLYRGFGDRLGEAACLNSLGIVARTAGRGDQARELLTEALEIRRAMDDEAGMSATLSNLGVLAVDRSELEDAVALFEEAMVIDRRRGDDWGVACTASNLGVVRIEQGDPQEGRVLIAQAMDSFATLEDMDGVASCLEAMAGACISEDRFVAGVRAEGAAEALRRRSGLPADPAEADRKQGWLDRARTEMGDVAYDSALAEGGQMTAEQAVAYALGRMAPLS